MRQYFQLRYGTAQKTRQQGSKRRRHQQHGNQSHLLLPLTGSSCLPNEGIGESRLDWGKLDEPAHCARFDFVKRLLDVRRRKIVPVVARIGGNAGAAHWLDEHAFAVRWKRADGGALWLCANVGEQVIAALSRFRGTVSGIVIQDVLMIDEPDDFWSDEPPVWQRVLEFEVSYEG